MDQSIVALLAAGMLVAAFLYASVGHGGASAYIAALAIAGVAPAEMRPIALQLNVLVSVIATVKFTGPGISAGASFWPFAVTSIPAAYLAAPSRCRAPPIKYLSDWCCYTLRGSSGGARGIGDEIRPTRDVPLALAMAIGAGLGVLSGLTGVGGGIFLSPVLLLLGWAGTKQTSAVAAPFILVNSLAALAAGFVKNPALPPDYAWLLMAAVVAGGWAGAEYGSRRFSNPIIRRALALVLAIAGGKMVLV